MASRVASIEIYEYRKPREHRYLGAQGEGDIELGEHLFVRRFNGAVYPHDDRSVVVRLRDPDGAEGWGETYGLVAPRAVAAIIDELLGPFLLSQSWDSPAEFWHAAYALQRVRGYWGGYFGDALAALDIALWDLNCRRDSVSLQKGLGRTGNGALPCYVTGLGGGSKTQRVEAALDWQARGFDRIKLPANARDSDGLPAQMIALREALGDEAKLAVDGHWTMDVAAAVALANDLAPMNPWFLEAPTIPEDITAQRAIAAQSPIPIALGEEWRTEWDYRPRRECCAIIQPEIGHTGITQLVRIADLAREAGAALLPHATIGLGIFMSASIRASFALRAEGQEYHPGIYQTGQALLDGMANCDAGAFAVPDTPGHGVVPNAEAFRYLSQIGGGEA